MVEEHALELAANEKRTSAIRQLHNEEMEQMKLELRQMAEQLISVCKTTNRVIANQIDASKKAAEASRRAESAASAFARRAIKHKREADRIAYCAEQ